MSLKVYDGKGRWRNKTVAFRISPEEDEQLETAVRLSGLTKQDYIIRRLQGRDVVVQGNPRVYTKHYAMNSFLFLRNCSELHQASRSTMSYWP